MTRSSIVTLATLSLLFGCASKQESPTSSPGNAADPGAGAADGGAADDGGPKPQVRMSTSSGSAGLQKAGPKAKPSKLISKKPPKSGDDKKPSGTPVEIDPGTPVELVGFFPPVAGVGSHIEIFGSNFAPSAKNNTVTIGGKAQKVVSVADDRLVVMLASDVDGPITVRKGAKYKRASAEGAGKNVVTKASLTTLKKDGAFGRPRTKPGQGLLGTVYAIGKASTEVPDFGALGTPVTYVAVDNIDIAPGTYPQGLPQGDGQLTENFGVHFQGSLNVTEAGQYEICMTAGDGAIFYLDQNPIVDLDAAGDSREQCESLAIDPGEYAVDLLWYQNTGELGLKLTWSKDKGEKATIPATAFFPPDVKGLAAQLEGQ